MHMECELVQNRLSDTVLCSAGAPQGTVLLSFPFILFTLDFQTWSPVLLKCSVMTLLLWTALGVRMRRNTQVH